MGNIRVITLSNKPAYLIECIQSVINQTRPGTKHVIITDNALECNGKFPPAVWKEIQFFRAEPDEYVVWLSDDDIWYPNYAEDMAGFLDEHPDIQACYGISRHTLYSLETGVISQYRMLGEKAGVFSKYDSPLGIIDGGQMLVRRSALDKLERPLDSMTADATARLCDAPYMMKVAEMYGIYPVRKLVMENRTTPISAHTRVNLKTNTLYSADWRDLGRV